MKKKRYLGIIDETYSHEVIVYADSYDDALEKLHDYNMRRDFNCEQFVDDNVDILPGKEIDSHRNYPEIW